jgi:hypothetical protein
LSHCPTWRQVISKIRPPARVGSWSLEIIPALAEKGRASYDGQCSKGVDPWLFGPHTVRPDVTLYVLVRGAVYFFRVRTVTKEGVSDGSEVVCLLVE